MLNCLKIILIVGIADNNNKTARKKYEIICPLLAIPLILSLTACGGGAQNDTQNPVQGPDTSTDKVVGKDLLMSLNLSALESAGVNADRVIVTVFSGDFSRTVEVPQTDYSATAEFSSLIVGEYSVSVRVMDGETEVATGSGTAQITLNTVSVVDLVLELNSGGLVVNVCGVPPEPSENTFVATAHYRVVTGPDRRIDNSGIDGVSVHLRSDLPYANLAAGTEITAHLQLNREWEDPDAMPLVSVSHENSIKLSTTEGDLIDFSGCSTRVEHATTLPTSVIFGAPLYIRADINVDGTEMLVDAEGNLLLDSDGSSNTRKVKKNSCQFR